VGEGRGNDHIFGGIETGERICILITENSVLNILTGYPVRKGKEKDTGGRRRGIRVAVLVNVVDSKENKGKREQNNSGRRRNKV